MTWLVQEIWLWMVLAALAGAVLTGFFSTTEVKTERWIPMPVPEEPEVEEAPVASTVASGPVEDEGVFASPFPEFESTSGPRPWEEEELWTRPVRRGSAPMPPVAETDEVVVEVDDTRAVEAIDAPAAEADEWDVAADSRRGWATETTAPTAVEDGTDVESEVQLAEPLVAEAPVEETVDETVDETVEETVEETVPAAPVEELSAAEKIRLELARLEAELVKREQRKRELLEAERAETERAETERAETGTAQTETARTETARAETAAEVAAPERRTRKRSAPKPEVTDEVAPEQAEAELLEAERLEAERAARAKARAQRAAATRARNQAQRAEQDRAQQDRAQQDRAEAERAEQERTDAEAAEKARLKAERAAAARERAKAKRAEAARLKAEQQAAEQQAAALAAEQATSLQEALTADEPATTGPTWVDPNDESDDWKQGPFGPGSAYAAFDGSAPRGYSIKASMTTKLYHSRSSRFYSRTQADVWFDSEEHAEAAGFMRWDQRGSMAHTVVHQDVAHEGPAA